MSGQSDNQVSVMWTDHSWCRIMSRPFLTGSVGVRIVGVGQWAHKSTLLISRAWMMRLSSNE